MIEEIFQVFFGTIWTLITSLWEIGKVVKIFTPEGMVALWLGVPIVVVSIVVFLIKRLCRT